MTEIGEVIKSGAADKIADLVQRLAGPMCDEVGAILGDKARVYRVKNIVSTMQKTERILHDAGLPANAVPPRLLLPIVENCSVEADDSLQELWAGLLATASQRTDAVSPAFVETLKQLTPAEAQHLERIHSGETTPQMYTAVGQHKSFGEGFERLGFLRRDFEVTLTGGRMPHIREPRSIDDIMREAQSAVERAIDSLETEIGYRYLLTAYAKQFLDACHGPLPSTRNDGEAGV